MEPFNNLSQAPCFESPDILLIYIIKNSLRLGSYGPASMCGWNRVANGSTSLPATTLSHQQTRAAISGRGFVRLRLTDLWSPA